VQLHRGISASPPPALEGDQEERFEGQNEQLVLGVGSLAGPWRACCPQPTSTCARDGSLAAEQTSFYPSSSACAWGFAGSRFPGLPRKAGNRRGLSDRFAGRALGLMRSPARRCREGVRRPSAVGRCCLGPRWPRCVSRQPGTAPAGDGHSQPARGCSAAGGWGEEGAPLPCGVR